LSGVPLNLEIRNELPSDVPRIEALTVAAFLNAPHTSHTEQFIVAALRRSGQLAVSLVANLHEVLIGHVALSPVAISDGATGWFGLGPISVLPAWQGQGVGSQLMHESLRILRERGAAGCVVLGEPDYYGRFGFRADPRLVLEGVPPEYFQVIYIDGSHPNGIVTYAEAFNAKD
jgi:putative acetyltransferase